MLVVLSATLMLVGLFFAVTKVTVSVSCKLDWEEKLFDFYVESIALRIKMLINIALF